VAHFSTVGVAQFCIVGNTIEIETAHNLSIGIQVKDCNVPEANVPLKKVNVGYQAKTRAHNNQ
jgi:hypothetical protein